MAIGEAPESAKGERATQNVEDGVSNRRTDVTDGEYVLFPPDLNPGGRYILTDLRKQYPELASVKEFQEINTWQMFFVWMYASPCSPYNKMALDPYTKLQGCIERTFYEAKDKPRSFATQKVITAYKRSDFGENVTAAIRKMELFDVPLRIEAKCIIDKLMNDYRHIVNTNILEISETDERKKHIDMVATIRKELADMIHQAEDGFGIRQINSNATNGKNPRKLLDIAYERRRQQ